MRKKLKRLVKAERVLKESYNVRNLRRHGSDIGEVPRIHLGRLPIKGRGGVGHEPAQARCGCRMDYFLPMYYKYTQSNSPMPPASCPPM